MDYRYALYSIYPKIPIAGCTGKTCHKKSQPELRLAFAPPLGFEPRTYWLIPHLRDSNQLSQDAIEPSSVNQLFQ